MKRIVWPVSTLLWLTACATAQKPVPVLEVCPKPPMLELDVPARDWQGQMRDFFLGTLPTPPDYSLHSTPAKLPTTR